MFLVRERFLVFVILMVAYFVSSKAASTNWFLQKLAKIFGGSRSYVQDHPYIVNVRRGGEFKCGGSLITPKCVLTAAHCLEDKLYVNDLSVYSGQNCHSDNAEKKQVQYFRVPQQYNFKSSLDMDVAVLKLENAFKNNESQPIDIDYSPLHTYDNLTIVGWGDTGFWVSNRCLKAAHVNVTPHKVCTDTIGRLHSITANMFCADGVNGTDACPGDSGGPVLHAGKLVGVVSWGWGCGCGTPGVYTRLSSNAISSFLKETIQKHCMD